MNFTKEQIELLEDTHLLQTAEALGFVADLISQIHFHLEDDGKIGLLEGAQIGIQVFGGAMAAFKDISQVPHELAELTPNDVEILGDVIFPAFKNFPSRQRDRVNASIGALRELVNVYLAFTAAPVAHPVPDAPAP